MTAVSDASSLCYLTLIGAAHILPALFRRIVIPQAVLDELTHPTAPAPLRALTAQLPAWLEVHPDAHPPFRITAKLHAGELAAIQLAETLAANIVLIDEKAARKFATGRGLVISGTLGVLGEAGARGLISVPDALQRLHATNFRCSPALLRSVLLRFQNL